MEIELFVEHENVSIHSVSAITYNIFILNLNVIIKYSLNDCKVLKPTIEISQF